MAPSGEGASAAPSSSAYEGGGGEGVGGKFRKRPFRKTHATPYDRPPTALRNPSWLSKLVVEPASKLIASSAQRFFASVFLKRLPPPPSSLPPPPPESNQGSSDKHPEAVLKAEAREAAIDDNQNLIRSTDGGGISELEQLLKRKTFTRSEIDQLTELLHSRAVDLPLKDGDKGTIASTSKQVSDSERQQEFLVSLEEQRIGSDRSHGLNSTPGISKRVLEEDIASPAEIAKAYMGSQVSKVSPSMLGLRSRAVREGAVLLSNVPYTPKSTIVSSSKKGSAHEVLENGFTTPRSRGRSAIYSMARTPYSRVHQTAFEKGSGIRNYAFGGPLLPAPSLKEPYRECGSHNLALKRRSSVIDEDLGSVGPMRRIRQKHTLLSHKLSLPHGIGGVSDAVKHPSSLTQKFPPTTEWKHEGPKVIGENDFNHTPRKSYAHVPPKSSEMAARILEHLEKMTPKEKSAESKLVAARENSPAKLTTDMLHGQALKSLEDMDHSKLLQCSQEGHKLEDWSHSSSLSAYASAPRKEDGKEANGLKFDSQRDMSTHVEKSNITASTKGALTSAEASDLVTKSVAQHPQKKRTFMMSAHEDSLELDDDVNSNGPASEPLPEGRGNQDTSAINQNSSSAEGALLDKAAALPETKTALETISGNPSDLEIGNATNVGREKADFTLPTSLEPSTTSQLVTLPASAVVFENPKQAIGKNPVFQNSSSSVTEFSGPKPLSWTSQKPEISSFDGVGTGGTGASLGIPAVEKDKDSNLPGAKSNGKRGNLDSVAWNSTSSGGMSSVVPISSDNGPLSISPSTGFTDQFLGNSASNLTSSSSTINSATTTSISAASISSPVVSTSVTPSMVTPIFKSGFAVEPSTSASSAAGAETSITKTNTEKEANFGRSSNSPFGSTSFGPVGTGNSIFGLSSTLRSSTAFSQSQGSLSSTGFGSMFSSQSSVAGTGAATANQGLPSQFGSSASSPVFETSGVASFTSSTTLFSSSTTTTKLFGTSTGFGLSTSTPSAETKSVSLGTGATSSIFNFGGNDSSSSSETNAISSNGVSAPITFSFNTSSSATTSVTNNSSSAATPIFSFGGGSSSGNNMVSSSSGGSSSIFGVSPSLSSAEANPASSSSGNLNIFGSSWPASKSPPLSSTFNSSPSTAFSFGAGSTSFASNNAASALFGSSTAASSGPVFSFNTTSATNPFSPSPFNAQPGFGNSTPAFSASPGNNDQMNTEDSMAEDPVQSSMPGAAVFGQQPVSPSPGGFVFGSSVQSQTAPFQFGGQQNQAAPPNPSPFQATGSLEFSAGGSFSLGSGGGLGGDKSGRKIVKVNRNRNRRNKP